ncbi:MAG: MGH1-like glycoside hydrolase domain-containing protein, partial [Cyclobacteriaceae bacterium]
MVTRIKAVFFQCILVGGYLLAQGCEATKPNGKMVDSYQLPPNILNLSGVPNEPTDRSISTFCDLGAWHAYAIPDDPKYYGGFIGPFAMTRDNGIWLGKKFAHISLEHKNGQGIKFSEKAQFDQYPGWLEQKLISEDGDISLTLRLWFISNRSVAVTATILNNSKAKLELTPTWKGDIWLPDAGFNIDQGLSLTYSTTTHQYRFLDKVKIDVDSDGKAYSARNMGSFKIQPGGSAQTGIIYSVLFEGESNLTTHNTSLAELNQSFTETKTRWNKYHQAFPYTQNHWLDSSNFMMLRSKAIQTLINNWKSAAGELKHDGLFPSYHYQGFHGFWAWDSWKHAVALSRFHPDLAKQQVQAMFDFQNQRGMIADCIFRDTLIENHNWRDTKPPLAAWAVSEIFGQTEDTAFVKEMFPKLINYHQWWYNDRDHDKNGLCEY